MAENVTLAPLANLSNDGTAIATINANNTIITDAFADCLSLSGSQPNAMLSNLDMNGYNIVNLPAPSTIQSPVRLVDLVTPSSVNTNILSGNNVFTGVNIFNNYLEVTGGSPSFLNLYSAPPTNGTYFSSGGAKIGFHPLTYGAQSGLHQAASVYVKSTAAQDSSIAEYMVVFDSNLNSGSTPPSTGFDAAKVGFFNSAVTGSSASNASWCMANDLWVKAGDTGLFKVGAEFDITNDAYDFAVGVANAYNIYVSGNIGAFPVTSQIAISPAPNGTNYSAHYGLLINGIHTADTADIEISGGAAYGLSISGLLGGSPHSVASIKDSSVSPTGLWLAGTYTNAIVTPGFAVNASGQVAVCSASTAGASFLAIGMTTLSPNFGIFFSNTTPTAAVHDGSICLDTSGKLWLRTGGVWTQITVP